MKSIKIFFIIALIVSGLSVFAQVPPPPPAGHGTAGNAPAGGGAPIADGIGLTLAFGLMYGARKYYTHRRKKTVKIS